MNPILLPLKNDFRYMIKPNTYDLQKSNHHLQLITSS